MLASGIHCVRLRATSDGRDIIGQTKEMPSNDFEKYHSYLLHFTSRNSDQCVGRSANPICLFQYKLSVHGCPYDGNSDSPHTIISCNRLHSPLRRKYFGGSIKMIRIIAIDFKGGLHAST